MYPTMPDPLLPPGPTRRGAAPFDVLAMPSPTMTGPGMPGPGGPGPGMAGAGMASGSTRRATDGAPGWGPGGWTAQSAPMTATGDWIGAGPESWSVPGNSDGVGQGPMWTDHPYDDSMDDIGGARRRWRSWRNTLARVKRVEGERGIAVRTSVFVRYAAYVGVLLLCIAITHATFRGTAWSMGGTLMLVSAAIMCTSAALGTMFLPQKRAEIVEELRHFLFQISVIPGTAIALFIWVMNAYVSSDGQGDNFMGLLHNALPILYAFTVFFPALIYVKAVAGRRVLDRTQQDDQELMSTWTRQDRWIR